MVFVTSACCGEQWPDRNWIWGEAAGKLTTKDEATGMAAHLPYGASVQFLIRGEAAQSLLALLRKRGELMTKISETHAVAAIAKNDLRLNSRIVGSASVLAVLLSSTAMGTAWAQQTAAAPVAAEEIVVTGTRIVRDGYEAPTPTTVVGAEALAQQAAPSVIEYLNTVPTFSGNYTPASSTRHSSGSPGTASVNLRNLGTVRTLVLVDGQRSVGSNPTGLVDVSTVPEQLISRVDVVTGGASSAYGSDAVAGVVNFILDKRFTGVKGEIAGGITTYGDDPNWKVALTAGTPFANGRGHFTISGSASANRGILLADRDWNKQGWQIITNPNYTPTNGEPNNLLLNHVGPATMSKGGIIVSGPLKGIAFGEGGTPYRFAYGPLVSGALMQGGEWWAQDVHIDLGATLEPRLSRQNIFTRVSYELSDNVEVFAQANWYHIDSLSYAYGNLFFGGLPTSTSNPFLPAEVAAQAATLGLSQITLGHSYADMGRNGLSDSRHTLRSVVGINGAFEAAGTDWTWDAYYQTGTSRNSNRVINSRNNERYNLAVDSIRDPATGAIACRVNVDADPSNDAPDCVPYNPFGIGVNSQAALNYVLGNAYRFQKFTQDVVAATISGDPFDTWAGPVSVATGVEHRREVSTGFVGADNLTNPWYAGNYRPTLGKYHVSEAFLETVVPLARDESWARNLELNGAVRGTDYSSSGYVTTWKVGFTYSPIDDLTFRVTRSRDIRAPNINDLFASGNTTTNNAIDPATGLSVQYRSTNRGNVSLNPEKADATGLGVVFQPSFIPGFNASVDYWNIDLKDAITTVTAQQTVDLCYQGNPAFCQAINGGAPLISTGSAFDNQIFIQPFNLAQQLVRGIDFEAGYQLPLAIVSESWEGEVSLRGLATRYLKNYQNNTLTPPTDSVGGNADGGPPRWRWSASATYTNDPLTVTFLARGVSSGKYNTSFIECTSGCPTSTATNRTINDNSIAGATYFDISFNYEWLVGSDNATSIETFLNVRNLFNTDPVIIGYIGNFAADVTVSNPLNYDQNGRVFRAGVRFKM